MKKSLQRHLSLTLGIVILFAGLAAAAISFSLAYFEAKELQDDMLRQIAILSVDKSPDSTSPDVRGDDGMLSDPESRVTILHIPRDDRPEWLAADLPGGFHTLTTGTNQLRIFVRDDGRNARTVVAQPTDAIDEIALNGALRTLIPLLLLLPLMGVMIAFIVRRELAPIIRLSRSLDEQPAERPQTLNDDDLPKEIVPFIGAINRLLVRVNQLMEQQRRFIADAAHELRSPLTALSVQAQNLLHADTLAVMRERAVPLQAGIERARQLTEQLLSLAKTQASNCDATQVNVSEMARELIAQHIPYAAAKRIDLGLEEIAPLTLLAVHETLWMLLKNALENALKYTPDGGEVTLRLLSDNFIAVIEVIDSGPGIPVCEHARVFDSFYRVPGTAGEGSGLGLAIAREAASRLGGTISLHNRDQGTGLVFRYQQRTKV